MNNDINLKYKTILVTGASGFIGSFLIDTLLKNYDGIKIIGIDNLNNYYDVNLKIARLENIQKYKNFKYIKEDISNKNSIFNIFKKYSPDIVINLAAQAGVRYSITNPDAYIQSNIIGFYNILEACRNYPVKHLVYASSSSVYGANKKIPYSVDDNVDCPVSLYAATKKSNELLAYSYSKLYDIKATGLRFFTVYGPAGRPDMAYFDFTNKMVNKEEIYIYNYGNCKRDFTYIDDIITGITRVIQKYPNKDENGVRHKIYNIGNSSPENLLDFIEILKKNLIETGVLPIDYDLERYKKLVPMQPGDVEITYADVNEMKSDFGFKPKTSLNEGLHKFAQWYKQYYQK